MRLRRDRADRSGGSSRCSARARPGDVLVLTKPLGTGMIAFARPDRPGQPRRAWPKRGASMADAEPGRGGAHGRARRPRLHGRHRLRPGRAPGRDGRAAAGVDAEIDVRAPSRLRRRRGLPRTRRSCPARSSATRSTPWPGSRYRGGDESQPARPLRSADLRRAPRRPARARAEAFVAGSATGGHTASRRSADVGRRADERAASLIRGPPSWPTSSGRTCRAARAMAPNRLPVCSGPTSSPTC